MRERVANSQEKVQSFVECFNKRSVPTLISNLNTRVDKIEIAGRPYPISINEKGQRGNCYICNPITGYIDYAVDETRNFASIPVLGKCLRGMIVACSPLMRATGLDNIVHVNNWLFSTNPVPQISPAVAREMKDKLTKRFPDRAIALRSLNTLADADTISALKGEGYRMLPSRQIYIFADHANEVTFSSTMKRDRSLLRNTPFKRVGNTEFQDHDYERCAHLYAMLYLEKYTALNPQYTATYLRQMHRQQLIELEGLRDENGIMVAVTGLFANGNTLTQPIVGYDTTLSQNHGLYRMVMAIAQDHAIKNELYFNMSAGAGHFKRRRRAIPSIEFTAIYDRHLPRTQRIATLVVQCILTWIGIPLLQRFEL